MLEDAGRGDITSILALPRVSTPNPLPHQTLTPLLFLQPFKPSSALYSIFADMTDAGPSTPRRSRRHVVPTSPVVSTSKPQPSRDVATSAVAGPPESRPSKFPRLMSSVAGPSEPQPSGHHNAAMSVATRPTEPRPSPQHDPTNSAYPVTGQKQCSKCHRWQNLDQFESVDRSGRRRQTKTCARCRPKAGKVCISLFIAPRKLLTCIGFG